MTIFLSEKQKKKKKNKKNKKKVAIQIFQQEF